MRGTEEAKERKVESEREVVLSRNEIKKRKKNSFESPPSEFSIFAVLFLILQQPPRPPNPPHPTRPIPALSLPLISSVTAVAVKGAVPRAASATDPELVLGVERQAGDGVALALER